MADTTILYQHDEEGVARITLDRPDVHNAFDEEMIAQLTDAFNDVCTNEHVRFVVLQANGPSFCAGADLNWMKRATTYGERENVRDAEALSNMLAAIAFCPKPVIAAINGPAYGGGVGLIACADIAVAVASAKFRLSEVRLGLTPATISPFVIRAIGERQARRWFVTAEPFSAETALGLELVHEVVADEHALRDRVHALTDLLLGNAPHAIAEAKKLVLDFGGRPISPDIRAETARRIAKKRAGVEARDGIKAFFEETSPGWLPDRLRRNA